MSDAASSAMSHGVSRLCGAFFQRDPVTCARELIGCRLVWRGCAGRIVETEAYAAVGDPACHTWVRPSARAFVASHQAGDAYVYLSFGMHWLFNIVVKGPVAGFVLLRALEPLDGHELMRARRGDAVKDARLAAGPGCLARALSIDGAAHGLGFLHLDDCGILPGPSLVACCAGPRIGISRATELPWRFGDPASASLSRKF